MDYDPHYHHNNILLIINLIMITPYFLDHVESVILMSLRFPQYASVDGEEGGEIDMAALGNRGDQPDGISCWADFFERKRCSKMLSISIHISLSLYIYIYIGRCCIYINLWCWFYTYFDLPKSLLTLPSQLSVLRGFLHGSEDTRRRRWPRRSAARRIWFCQRGRPSDPSGTSVGGGGRPGRLSPRWSHE